MSLLVSTQSFEDDVPTEYGYLLEMDETTGAITRKARVETPVKCKSEGDRIKPGLRGMSIFKNLIYASTWNRIIVIHPDTFQIVKTISHKWMSDLHGIFVNEDGIWVTSSLPDAIILYDFNGSPISSLWLPETALYKERCVTVDKSLDWRSMGKGFRGFREYHANHIQVRGDHVFVTGRGKGSNGGRIIRLDRKNFIKNGNLGNHKITLFAKNLHGPHDGIWDNDHVWITETLGSSVACLNHKGRVVKRKKVLESEKEKIKFQNFSEQIKNQLKTWIGKPGKKMTHWTRGLCYHNNTLYVGQSQKAGVHEAEHSAARIVKIDKAAMKITDCFYIHIDDYPETRIFQIVPF